MLTLPPSVPGPCEPEDLIDGIIFAANYLGSTQLLSERNPSKNIRMMQAQEAVSRVKVGLGLESHGALGGGGTSVGAGGTGCLSSSDPTALGMECKSACGPSKAQGGGLGRESWVGGTEALSSLTRNRHPKT